MKIWKYDTEQRNVKLDLWRLGMLIVATAIIVLVMPRTDHQSYNYELNQPWRYPLLTADFDMPVVRDTTAARVMRDSINANFIPFVLRDNAVAERSQALLGNALSDSVSMRDINLLKRLLANVYKAGVLDAYLSETIGTVSEPKVRTTNLKDTTVVYTKDASMMLTPEAAYAYIDSAFNAANDYEEGALTPYISRALYGAIEANIMLDSVMDEKYRSKELAAVSAPIGMIKQGQRIVDRGEIIDSQTFTNLNTYTEMLSEMESSDLSDTYYTIGQSIMVLLLLLCLYAFLWRYRKTFFLSLRRMAFLMTFITLFVVFSVAMFDFVSHGLSLVPFAMVAVIVIIFFDARTAIMSLLVTVLICSLIATFPHQFIIMQLLAGFFAAISIHQITKRSQLVQTAAITFVVYSIVYFGMLLVTGGNLQQFDPRQFAYFAINAVILSFAYVLVVIMERVFGFTSNVTLVELSDINNPLLRRLAEEAPGTFQHSMQVSTLAAEAARAIDANTLLVRIGALYHDIGKLDSPAFFTENQHGVNPHNGLDPENSAKKIISHVNCGLKLANANKLPEEIKDFIREHHGNGVARYFYTTACNENGAENVDKSNFQYPGPAPQSKETAILMMADAVEAASRSLKEYTQESITNLVNKIIDGQTADGMFRNAPITFQDIEKVKQTFIKRLATMYHTRIAYPEMKK